MQGDDAREKKDQRLKALGLKPRDAHEIGPLCVHCGQPFNPVLAQAGDHGLCDQCLHKD